MYESGMGRICMCLMTRRKDIIKTTIFVATQ